MAQNTLGRKILEREPELKIFGDMYRLRAEVAVLNAFSAPVYDTHNNIEQY